MSRRLLVFLYSTPNLVGCGLALMGLVLFFTGLLGSLWPLAVGGLYLAGYLLAPRPRRSVVDVSAATTPEEVRRKLDRLVDEVSPRLPQAAVAHVRSIRDSIETTLSEEARVSDTDGSLLLIRRTALDYLPVAIRNYLDLPPTFARLQPLKDGKTAERLLIEQLALMDDAMRQIAEESTLARWWQIQAVGSRRTLEETSGGRRDEHAKRPGAGTVPSVVPGWQRSGPIRPGASGRRDQFMRFSGWPSHTLAVDAT